MLDGDPFIQLDEQYDLKRVGEPFAWQVVYVLNDSGAGAWKPDLAIWKSPQGRLKGRDAAREEKFAALGADLAPLKNQNFGSKHIAADRPEEKVCDLSVWYPWSEIAEYVGFVDSAGLVPGVDRNKLPFLAVLPVHAGNWRSRPDLFNGSVFTRAGRLELRWPLVVEAHPNSLLHTGEYDPALPFTFGRRQWAFCGGPPQYHDGLFAYRAQQGYVTLDDYKDWVLDWPADPKVTYPRLVFSKADVARIKPTLAEHPAAKVLEKFLYFQEKPDAARQRQLVERLLADPATVPEQQRPMQSPAGQAYHNLHYGGDWLDPLLVTRSIYRQTMMTLWSHDVDELLAAGELTPEQRQHAAEPPGRALLSAGRAGPQSARLDGPSGQPEHADQPLLRAEHRGLAHPGPSAGRRSGCDVSQEYVRYKLAMNTAPGGAWSELISYFVAGYSHQLQAAAVMSRT